MWFLRHSSPDSQNFYIAIWDRSSLTQVEVFSIFIEGRIKVYHIDRLLFGLYGIWSFMKITLYFRKMVKQTIYFELFDSPNCTGAFGCYELELILFSEVSVSFMKAWYMILLFHSNIFHFEILSWCWCMISCFVLNCS